MKDKLISIMGRFNEKKILVIGDIILDKYIFGNVSRISPEAPIPLVDVGWENYVPGGSANAANNLASLGAKVFVIGVTGADLNSEILMNKLKSRGIEADYIIKNKNRRTILKERVVAHNQQLLRIDYDVRETISDETENIAIENIKKIINEVDAIIVSDYAKGFITKRIMEELIKYSNKKPIIIDPRPNNLMLYKGATLVTPNYDEASRMAEILGKEEENINIVGHKLRRDLNCDILITRGPRGMTLFSKDVKHFPTKAREIYDVSGAGDTVIAALALSIASGATLEEAIILANYAAGIVVAKFGTATTTIIEIEKAIKEDGKG